MEHVGTDDGNGAAKNELEMKMWRSERPEIAVMQVMRNRAALAAT